ncbi:MAG: hypothetical protein Q9209_003731 [Squamulea sp. 1 TL-2023]
METPPEPANVSLPADPTPFMGLTDEVVTILIGPEERPFYIHKALLSSKSPYFRAAFEGSFKEAVDKAIRLPEDDSKLFPYYVLWVYEKPLETEHPISLDEYCRLYILADKLGSEQLRNLAIGNIRRQAFIDLMPMDLKSTTINCVYDTTLPDSPLRRILVDLLAWQFYSDDFDLADADPEYLLETLKACTDRLPSRLEGEVAPFDKSECETYHVHRDGGSCAPSKTLEQ